MKYAIRVLLLLSLGYMNNLEADTCPPLPDENHPRVIPEGWNICQFSTQPQYENGIKFVQIQILPQVITGKNGVVCTYYAPIQGKYSICLDKFVAKDSGQWASLAGKGYLCSQSLEDCKFFVVQ